MSIYKKSYTKSDGTKAKSPTYRIALTVNGKRREWPGFTDKMATKQKEAELIRKMERGEMDLVDKTAEHLRKPLVEVAAEFLGELKGKGNDAMYCRIVKYRMDTLASGCNWNLLSDLTGESFQTWRASKQVAEKSFSPKTLNDYLALARQFAAWCAKRGKMKADPFTHLEAVKVNGDIRRVRRALTDEEVVRLLNVATPTRKVVYRLALLTGLRRGEIAALRWGDVQLDGERPTLTARAATTKNAKAATILLRDDLATALRAIRPNPTDVRAKVFANVPDVETLYRDLAKAGIDKKDAQGKWADFHALRHTLGTNLAKVGTPIRVAMEVMRHSDAKLTTKTYTDCSQLPMADVANALPRYEIAQPAEQQSEQQSSDFSCHFVSSDATLSVTANSDLALQLIANGSFSHLESSYVNVGENAPCRTRTYPKPSKHQQKRGISVSEQQSEQQFKLTLCQSMPSTDKHLAKLQAVWPTMPAHLRNAILLLISSL